MGEHESDDTVVALDTYNSDLNLVIDKPFGFAGHPLNSGGFAFMWAGARATYGVHKGKICFEVKVVKHIDCPHLPADEPNPHVVRLGFSVESASMQLGEEPLSYGYGGTGKMSTNCQFRDYGQEFMEGDVVMAYLNMDSDLVQIGFAKNGKFLGWAYKSVKSTLKGQPLFPHVLSKNCAFEVNFGQKERPYFNQPEGFQEYKFLGCIPLDLRVRGVKAPERREDCEMIMMCGLPGAGKSTWAAEYSEKHADKKYNVLGTNNIIDKMKIMGLPRKRNYAGRWQVLIQMATKCINRMFEVGSKLRRNYILDQTNVYPTAQRRKMKNFERFKRKAVVVVPTDLEFQKRCNKREREEGKDVPDCAVSEMKANFKLPEVGDIFCEVTYTELQRDEAEKLVLLYNEERRSAVGPPRKRFHGFKNFSSAGPTECHTHGGFHSDGHRGFRGSPSRYQWEDVANASLQNRGSPSESGYGSRNIGEERGPQDNFVARERSVSMYGSRRFPERGGERSEFFRGSDLDGFSGEDSGRRGLTQGNFGDSGGVGKPVYKDYNRGGPFDDYKGEMGGKNPDSAGIKPRIGGMGDTGAGVYNERQSDLFTDYKDGIGDKYSDFADVKPDIRVGDLGHGEYQGRQSNRFGQGLDVGCRTGSDADKFRNSGSSIGYSGPSTHILEDGGYGREDDSRGSDFYLHSRYSGRDGESASRDNRGSGDSSVVRDGSADGYGRSVSQSEHGGRGSLSYRKDNQLSWYRSGCDNDRFQGSTYDKDSCLGGYVSDASGGYRISDAQNAYKSIGTGNKGGYCAYSSRGSEGYATARCQGGYSRSGPQGGYIQQQNNCSSQGGYDGMYSTSDCSPSGGQVRSRGNQSIGRSGTEQKSGSQGTQVSVATRQSELTDQQSIYSTCTNVNTPLSGTEAAGYGNCQNRSYYQPSRRRWSGTVSTCLQANAEHTTAYDCKQVQATPAVQPWGQMAVTTGPLGATNTQQAFSPYYYQSR